MLYRIINKEDRGVYYYNSYAVMYRAAHRAQGRRRAATRRAAAAPVSATRTPVSKPRPRGNVRASPQASIGRYKGGSTVRKYDPEYHSSSRKRGRRSARQSEAKRLGTKKYGKYSQLM